jgi:Raf kinase inhibitor-like YbhB/YbcL family protein
MRRAATALALAALAGCGGGDDSADPAPGSAATDEIRVESPAFTDGGRLPARFTCDGEGVSPPLRWSGAPGDAQDLVLVADDPDMTQGAFTHWTVWKLPLQPDGSGSLREDDVTSEMEEGQNDFGDRGWGAACPPEGDGPHRYVFTLYALDRPAELGDGATAAQVRAAVAASAVAQGRLSATYDR